MRRQFLGGDFALIKAVKSCCSLSSVSFKSN